MEKHWEILKWVVEYIDANKSIWEENKLEKIKYLEDLEERERWERLGEMEKRRELERKIETEKTEKLTRSVKIELAKEKRKLWQDWRDPLDATRSTNNVTVPTTPLETKSDAKAATGSPENVMVPAENTTKSAEGQGGEGGEGDPKLGKDPPSNKKSTEVQDLACLPDSLRNYNLVRCTNEKKNYLFGKHGQDIFQDKETWRHLGRR